MKFPQNFLAGAGVLTAGAGVLTAGTGAGGEITGVCTALIEQSLYRQRRISSKSRGLFAKILC